MENKPKQTNAQLAFVVLAMFFYASIRITAFICATIIALRGNLLLGGILFGIALFMKFEFKNPDPKPDDKDTP